MSPSGWQATSTPETLVGAAALCGRRNPRRLWHWNAVPHWGPAPPAPLALIRVYLLFGADSSLCAGRTFRVSAGLEFGMVGVNEGIIRCVSGCGRVSFVGHTVLGGWPCWWAIEPRAGGSALPLLPARLPAGSTGSARLQSVTLTHLPCAAARTAAPRWHRLAGSKSRGWGRKARRAGSTSACWCRPARHRRCSLRVHKAAAAAVQ